MSKTQLTSTLDQTGGYTMPVLEIDGTDPRYRQLMEGFALVFVHDLPKLRDPDRELPHLSALPQERRGRPPFCKRCGKPRSEWRKKEPCSPPLGKLFIQST